MIQTVSFNLSTLSFTDFSLQSFNVDCCCNTLLSHQVPSGLILEKKSGIKEHILYILIYHSLWTFRSFVTFPSPFTLLPSTLSLITSPNFSLHIQRISYLGGSTDRKRSTNELFDQKINRRIRLLFSSPARVSFLGISFLSRFSAKIILWLDLSLVEWFPTEMV